MTARGPSAVAATALALTFAARRVTAEKGAPKAALHGAHPTLTAAEAGDLDDAARRPETLEAYCADNGLERPVYSHKALVMPMRPPRHKVTASVEVGGEVVARSGQDPDRAKAEGDATIALRVAVRDVLAAERTREGVLHGS